MKRPSPVLRMMAVAICLALPAAVFAGSEVGYVPYSNLGGPDSEECHAIVQATDTGFVLAGWTDGYYVGSGHSLLIVKTDKNGSPQWARVDNDTGGFSEINSMVRTSDGGYALAGYRTRPGSATGRDVIVIRLDPDGSRRWVCVYAGQSDDCANSIIVSASGGFTVCGYTYSFNPQGYKNIFVMNVDDLGNMVWTRVYYFSSPKNGDDEAFSIAEADGNTNYHYAMCGSSCADDTSNHDAFVMLLDDIGELVGQPMVVPGAYFDEARSVIVAGDTVAVAGNTMSYGQGYKDIFVWRLAVGVGGSLSTMWRKTYGWATGNEWIYGDKALIAAQVPRWQQPSVPVYTLAGTTTSRGPDLPNPNSLLFVVQQGDGIPFWSFNGNTRVHPSVSGNGTYDVAYQVINAFGAPGVINPWYDYGYVVAGTTSLQGLGNYDFHFFSVGPCGNMRVCMKGETLHIDTFSVGQRTVLNDTVHLPRDTFVLRSVDVAAVPVCTLQSDAWIPIEPLPLPVYTGGVMARCSTAIHLLPGGNRRAFLRYELGGGDWWHWEYAESIPPGPKNKRVRKGATMTSDDRHVYVLKGNNTFEFYEYVPDSSVWYSLPQPPFLKKVKGGFSATARLTTADAGPVTYVYAGSGAGNNEWARFNTTSGRWEACVPATLPVAKAKIGSGLAYDGEGKMYFLLGGGRENELYVTDISSPQPTWTRKRSLPLAGTGGRNKKIGEGGALVASSFDGMLYALKGKKTYEFWRYSPAADSWKQMPDVGGSTRPVKAVKGGGSLVASPAEGFLYCTVGNKQTNFLLYSLPVSESLLRSAGAPSNASVKRVSASAGKLVVQNPTRGMLSIRYSLPTREPATVRIYNVAGGRAYELKGDRGSFLIPGLPAGVYVVKFQCASYTEERKLVVIE